MTTTEGPMSNRDRSVLRAVQAGRCEISGTITVRLVVDGMGCSDQFVGTRLVAAGLIASPGPAPAPARLTAHGRALVVAA